MADSTLAFSNEPTPALGHKVVGFRSPTVDQERTYFLSVLYTFFASLAGNSRPTHLLGNVESSLDGLPGALLAALPDGYVIELFFSGSVVARYRLRDVALAEVEASPWFIVCDNNTARGWELVGVSKEGVPCLWNEDTGKWHQQLCAGISDAVTPAIAQETDAFSLPV